MHKIGRFGIYSILMIALFVHIIFLDRIRIWGAGPDLVFLSVLFFSLFLGARTGLEVGIAAGLLKDIFSMDIFGVNTLVLGATGLVAGILNTKFFKESAGTQLVLAFSFAVFSMLAHYGLVLKYASLGLAEYITCSVIPTGVYTAIIAVPIFSKLIDIYGLKESEDFL